MNNITLALIRALSARQRKFGERPFRTQPGGFTLIELIVVIVVLGVLAAIAMPTFMRQISKAHASEAKAYLGSINRAQHAYYTENSTFADSLTQLGFATSPESQQYSYSMVVAENEQAVIEAIPLTDTVKGYAGVVYVVEEEVKSQICEGSSGQTPSVTVNPTPEGLELSGC